VLRLGVAHERLPWQVLAGVGVGFAGVAVLAQPSGGAKAYGIALCVLSAVMWATGSFLSARLPMPADPFAATAIEMLAGGFAMLPLALFTVHHFDPSTKSIIGWIYLVVFGSIVGYTAYVWLLANAPIGLVSTYAYVNPVVAVLLGWGLANEPMTLRTMLAAAVIIGAVVVIIRYGARTKPEPVRSNVAPAKPVDLPVRRAEAR
jgi:drug/metabolite transporter (DMT)-like permease